MLIVPPTLPAMLTAVLQTTTTTDLTLFLFWSTLLHTFTPIPHKFGQSVHTVYSIQIWEHNYSF